MDEEDHDRRALGITDLCAFAGASISSANPSESVEVGFLESIADHLDNTAPSTYEFIRENPPERIEGEISNQFSANAQQVKRTVHAVIARAESTFHYAGAAPALPLPMP